MKKLIIIGAITALGLGACAYTQTDEAKPETQAEQPQSTCNPGDPGYPRCPTGGGTGGIID